ncbi:excinuclease ABC subunit UvrC [Anaerovibrio sp.]|uniref:excinuclease ABC subunit UvrC n=1 Tax=Anaerovibrio sp. TaxID=1872532 RepID=UPI001B5FFEDF|nr:excinuclease ABC subunit UvrC [Anaerovibrio sp.]MBP3232224.1 excinuclease ABC subunit UvrC [Anaerovibrio sp.]MBR2143674.1 excinuclease ABC subunit UvrC [Anaerovibrio sp.]
MNNNIEEKLALLPHNPGVYIMKDGKGKIIYVGKAISLKNRVTQYFRQNSSHSAKVRAMVARIEDFETILTGTEVEALILECNLIKKHRPKYNISLKDDKTYPYLKVTLQDTYPRVYITRRVQRDGGKYFGPYTNATALHETLKLLKRLFPIRSCKTMESKRPCLEYHIKRCMAPCADKISREEYMVMIDDIVMFLEGRTEHVEKSLEQRMLQAADKLEFEQAGRLRDQLLAVQKISEKQRIVTGVGDQDAIGMARSGIGVCVQIFYVRSGKMVGRDHFLLDGSDDETDEALLRAFLKQYYNQATFIPREILLPMEILEQELLEEWLEKQKNAKVILAVPKRGTKRDIVEMAIGNAKKALEDESARIKQTEAQTIGAVLDLGKYLGLSRPPYRMECFDISHIQGSETVASMVVFEGGVPKKSDYRRFKIRSAEGKPDDFKSMREVTERRYGKADAEMPDLIIIDGGKGQLSSACEIIRGAGHITVPVVGLAKRFEEVYREGESDPVILPRSSQALYLIQRIRDEAHRFAITYHRKLRNKRNLVSILDNVEGIGPKRRKILLEHFGNIEKIKQASVAEMADLDGMNTPSAEAVYNYFQQNIKW